MTLSAGFSERVFEFAFNAEFAAKNKAVLVGCPFIPTQQQEKDVAFDVEFVLKQHGGAITSLFLQHKVSRLIENRSGSNASRWDSLGGPYFCFDLDVHQYRRIHDLRAASGEEIYYCAPTFVGRGLLDSLYMSQTVTKSSTWLDVKHAGAISDSMGHSIIYAVALNKAVRTSSEERPVTLVPVGHGLRERRRYSAGFNTTEARALYQELYTSIERTHLDYADQTTDMPAALPEYRGSGDRREIVAGIRQLACEYFGLSWLLVVDK